MSSKQLFKIISSWVGGAIYSSSSCSSSELSSHFVYGVSFGLFTAADDDGGRLIALNSFIVSF